MARLLVFRGETLAQELDVEQLPVTIGRGPGNDLVLEDPMKSVSREHAEIRLEGSRYVLVDRQSENGIWAAGRRLPSIPFEADTVAVIGPFRLKMDGLPPEPTTVSPPPPVQRDRWAWLAGALRTPRMPAALTRLTPQQRWVAAGAVALVVAVGTLAVAGVVRSARERERTASELTASIVAANQQLGQGACADALARTIQPALAKAPGNADLLALRQRAEACLAPPPAPPPPQPSAVEIALASARDAMAQGGACDDALMEQITAILAEAPDHADALALKAEAEQCRAKLVKPSRPPPTLPVLAQRVPPENGGLEPLPGESDPDYQVRVRIMRQRYDDAVAAAASKDVSRSAIAALEAIARDATPQYLGIGAQLATTRAAFRETAQRVLAEARELAQKRRWNESLAKYNEAKEIDPALSVDAEVRKLQDDKRQAGLAVCRSARQRASYAPEQAPGLYRQVLDLLAPDEPCYVEAQKALAPK